MKDIKTLRKYMYCLVNQDLNEHVEILIEKIKTTLTIENQGNIIHKFPLEGNSKETLLEVAVKNYNLGNTKKLLELEMDVHKGDKQAALKCVRHQLSKKQRLINEINERIKHYDSTASENENQADKANKAKIFMFDVLFLMVLLAFISYLADVKSDIAVALGLEEEDDTFIHKLHPMND